MVGDIQIFKGTRAPQFASREGLPISALIPSPAFITTPVGSHAMAVPIVLPLPKHTRDSSLSVLAQ